MFTTLPPIHPTPRRDLIVASRFMGVAVDGHMVPHMVLYDEHPDFLELLAQLLDVVADDADVHSHVRAMIKHIQRTGDIDFQSGGAVLRFLFILRTDGVIQVIQQRHILRLRVIEVFPVDDANTTINDGFFHRGQTHPCRRRSAHEVAG